MPYGKATADKTEDKYCSFVLSVVARFDKTNIAKTIP
jgi:hypothetical protein